MFRGSLISILPRLFCSVFVNLCLCLVGDACCLDLVRLVVWLFLWFSCVKLLVYWLLLIMDCFRFYVVGFDAFAGIISYCPVLIVLGLGF